MDWQRRRQSIIAGMGQAPSVLCLSDRDHDAIIALLVKDGVIEQAGGNHHQLTAAGRILHVLHRLHDGDESGPWSLNDLRRYASVKNLDIDACKAALEVLEKRRIVVAQPSPRTPKWDLMTS